MMVSAVYGIRWIYGIRWETCFLLHVLCLFCVVSCLLPVSVLLLLLLYSIGTHKADLPRRITSFFLHTYAGFRGIRWEHLICT